MSLTTKRIVTIVGLVLLYLPFRYLGAFVSESGLSSWVTYPIYAILGGVYVFIAWKAIMRLKE
jgi:uncharacterized membrane protein